MPYHLSRRQRARMAASQPRLSDRTIPELMEVAADAGVQVPRGARKKQIIDAVHGAATPPAPGETETAGGE